jgi:F-type H+-transporting ATPase subunit gamma
MAKAKTIIKRRKSVQNTMKITRTMEMISTANFKKAANRATAFKPYATAIRQLIANVGRASGSIDHPLFAAREDASAPEAALVITANRGLCAAYNTNVIRLAAEHVKKAGKENVRFYISGKKGASLFRFRGMDYAESFSHIDFIPAWNDVEKLAADFLTLYEKGEISALSIFYTRFLSAGKQEPGRMVLLPVTPEESEEVDEGETETDYIFMPGAAELLGELVPLYFKINLYRCFLEAGTSEQVARMRAMKSATDAARKMIKYLTQQYNRARQTQITMDLLDIIGGSRVVSK